MIPAFRHLAGLVTLLAALLPALASSDPAARVGRIALLEGATLFRVSRDGAVGDLIVHYSIDAASTAGSGADFSALSGSVTILDGTSSADIHVVPIVDTDFEGPETLQLNLDSVNFGAGYYGETCSNGSPSSATLTITDDEANPVS